MLSAFNSYSRNWSTDNHKKIAPSVAVKSHPPFDAPVTFELRNWNGAVKAVRPAPPTCCWGSRGHHTGDEKCCFHALERAQRYKETKVQAD